MKSALGCIVFDQLHGTAFQRNPVQPRDGRRDLGKAAE